MSNKRTYEVRCASGAPAVPEPSWKFWPLLKWLLDFTKKQPSVSNIDKSDPSVSNISQPSISSPSPMSNPDIDSLPPTPQSSDSGSTSFPTNRKRKVAVHQNSIVDLTATIDKEIKELRNSFHEEDDMHHYAMSLAAKLRKLTEYQSSVAHRDIEMALFSAQYNCPPYPPTLNAHYSTPSNVPYTSPHPPPNVPHATQQLPPNVPYSVSMLSLQQHFNPDSISCMPEETEDNSST